MADESEFDFIGSSLAPLADSHEGAFGLKDDAATLTPRDGHEFVITCDMLIEGRHFLAEEPLDIVASRALRVNLSDLAAMGARPQYYLTSLAWPEKTRDEDRRLFVKGLARTQSEFGLALIGGDTTTGPGSLCISITAIGEVPLGKAILRSQARPGDLLAVTGTIGDSYLGLKALQEKLDWPDLMERYQIPSPRVEPALAIRAFVHAAIDISDGLLADVEHICKASQCGVDIRLEDIPVSSQALEWVEDGSDHTERLLELASGGDDYELALALPPEHLEQVRKLAGRLGLSVTPVGTFTSRRGLNVRHEGRAVEAKKTGFTHF